MTKSIIGLILFCLVCFRVSAQTKDGIKFTFTCQDKALKLNEMIYFSYNKQSYKVCQCQFFLSNIEIIYKDKKRKKIENSIHYTDIEIPKSLVWYPENGFNLENADSLEFTFGFDSTQNRSYRFKNPPENLMFWPDYLGGGYHYMKTNILYLDKDNNINAFNCHIGRGQIYNSENKPIKYIDNDFRIKIPIKRVDNFAVINLDISTIFDYPTAVLFSDYGGIMNNQKAMKMFCENIKAAFEK